MLLRTRSVWRSAKQQARRYHTKEDGSLIVFSLFLFIVMLMFGGIAVDLMLYENRRTHIQNSTDRAVLAAANLNQTVDPRTIVQDYLAKVGVPIDPEDVDVFEVGTAPVITGRQVAVNVTGGFDTILMHMVGVETLPYNAMSEAEESVNDIEVSLILDVSGSMGAGTKMSDMQGAAKTFLTNILAGADDDRVSVSLVPYSTQVSAGDDLLDELDTTHNHNHSHCVNFTERDFNTTQMQRFHQALDEDGEPEWTQYFAEDGSAVMSLDDVEEDGISDYTVDEDTGAVQVSVPDYSNPVALSQTAHFDPWRSYQSGMSLYYPVCRSDSDFHIDPWSNNLTNLNLQIDGFTANGNTSIDVAMKWGAALLDPSMRPALNNMIGQPGNDIDAAFFPRPHDFDYEDSLKFIVVMTDGINTTQYRLKDPFKEGMSPYFEEPDGDIVVRGEIALDDNGIDYVEPGNRDRNNGSQEEWYDVSRRTWKDNAANGSTQLSWLDAWANMTMARRAYGAYHNSSPYDADYFYDALYEPRVAIGPDTKDDQMAAICSAAKSQGIVVFSIGFEVTDHSASVMRSCASTPDHFYRVEGLDIEYAFSSIANQINQLKLTQ
jgi:Flp pilus assembly protein TadG